MSLHINDYVQELEPPEDAQGWCYGKNMSTKTLGWFPPTFVEPRGTPQ